MRVNLKNKLWILFTLAFTSIIGFMKRFHFIGIGGIGVSAIARMFLLEGKIVTGSDLSKSIITSELEKLGAKILYTPQASNISQDTELVIYTPAISENNPELMRAKELGIPAYSYPEMLGIITKEKYTIAVSGTHGKTTTTAMIAKILIDAELDPTVIVGSLLSDEKSNFIAGKSKYFVVEACEYKRAFLNIKPNIWVITNIDADHLDYYKDITDIQSAFRELAERLGTEDHLVCAPNDKNIAPVVENLSCKIHDYSLIKKGGEINLAGEHNKKNARAAFTVASILGVSEEKIINSLNTFKGTWRRFEFKGKTARGAMVYNDYAHHPTEVIATLAMTREMFPQKKITAIFQPHLYSRTKDHLEHFAEAFKDADNVFLAPIYAAREPFDASISSEIVAEKVLSSHKGNVIFYEKFEDIAKALAIAGENDVIVIMGAGDIGSIVDLLL